MEFKQLYVCQSCQSFYAINPEKAAKGCPNCKSKLVYVPVSLTKYDAMSEQEKENFQASVLNGNDLERVAIAAVPQVEMKEPEESQKRPFVSHASGWVKGMKFANKLVFAFFFIAAIAAFVLLLPSPLVAILASGLLFCIGFLLVGMTMVFLDLAKDVKAIRDHMDQQ